MVMGQMLTLTSCSDLVKIVSLIAELVLLNNASVGFLPSVTFTPLPSTPSFPPILAQIIYRHIHPAALLHRLNLFSLYSTARPSLPPSPPPAPSTSCEAAHP